MRIGKDFSGGYVGFPNSWKGEQKKYPQGYKGKGHTDHRHSCIEKEWEATGDISIEQTEGEWSLFIFVPKVKFSNTQIEPNLVKRREQNWISKLNLCSTTEKIITVLT